MHGAVTPSYSCRCRMRALPLVCRRWHKIMADASMWPVVDVEPRDDHDSPDADNMAVWLQRRSPGMRELTLRVSA
jgi:hypothetical protein